MPPLLLAGFPQFSATMPPFSFCQTFKAQLTILASGLDDNKNTSKCGNERKDLCLTKKVKPSGNRQCKNMGERMRMEWSGVEEIDGFGWEMKDYYY